MESHAGMDILCDAIGPDIDAGLRAEAAVRQPDPDSDREELIVVDESEPSREEPINVIIRKSSSSLGPASKIDSPVHRCDVCNKTYERADHLNRHLRSHENARPFGCPQCNKRFNRADLLNRHMGTHERGGSSGPTVKIVGERRPAVKRTDRASAACAQCAASKSKCEDEKPCARCRTRGLTCTQATPGSGPSRVSASESMQMGDHEGTPSRGRQWGLPDQEVLSQAYSMGASKSSSKSHKKRKHASLPHSGYVNSINSAYQTDRFNLDLNNGQQNGSLDDIFFYPNASGFDLVSDLQFWNFPFDEIQLPFIPEVDMSMLPGEPAERQQVPKIDVVRGYEAFKRSPWLWTPVGKDHSFNDDAHLDLTEEEINQGLAPTLHQKDLNGIVHYLGESSRDQMFGLAMSTNKHATSIPKFPSLDILNYTIHMFFVGQRYQVLNWIHEPTFNPSRTHPQLSMALASSGSTLVSGTQVWQMGLALQEVTRLGIIEFWEKDNRNTRELELVQAFCLCLDVGLWSGFKRKMEIAEGFAQPVITMLRRAGVFAGSHKSSDLAPTNEDSGAQLETKWKKWIRRESYKRLAIQLFIHDTQSSISFQKSPLLLLTELTFPLPESRSLWLAKSAAEWKARYLRRPPLNLSPVPRLIDVLHDLTLLDVMQDHVDVDLCFTTLIYGYWGQVWSFQESNKFYLGDPRGNSSKLWLTTQQGELFRDLDAFGSQILNLCKQNAEITVVKELFMMILYVSPDEVQRFAGKGGEEASWRASTVLQSWAQTADARNAAWHAGQVFSAAKALPPAELRGFYAIAVYFASLTLWAYAQLSSNTRQNHLQSRSQRPQMRDEGPLQIWLDAPETRDSRTFISMAHGVPGLNMSTKDRSPIFTPLDDPNVVLKIAHEIYRANFPLRDEPLPTLVENLGNLLRDLGSLADTRFSRSASEMAH